MIAGFIPMMFPSDSNKDTNSLQVTYVQVTLIRNPLAYQNTKHLCGGIVLLVKAYVQLAKPIPIAPTTKYVDNSHNTPSVYNLLFTMYNFFYRMYNIFFFN
ncbi:hypothetical protein HanRHA438_Chr13g0594181 [Helianthus annuus]|nr:hypothetical protein HanRHA438_Chr13g0594181 [Helianthus annuus]